MAKMVHSKSIGKPGEQPGNSVLEFVCIEPTIGELLLPYYIGELADGGQQEEIDRFERHVLLCFHCQEQLDKLAFLEAELKTFQVG